MKESVGVCTFVARKGLNEKAWKAHNWRDTSVGVGQVPLVMKAEKVTRGLRNQHAATDTMGSTAPCHCS